MDQADTATALDEAIRTIVARIPEAKYVTCGRSFHGGMSDTAGHTVWAVSARVTRRDAKHRLLHGRFEDLRGSGDTIEEAIQDLVEVVHFFATGKLLSE